MKKDNRIYRPELLTEEERYVFGEAVTSYVRKQMNEEEKRATDEVNEKLASGEWIEKDGKLYDARYYRG